MVGFRTNIDADTLNNTNFRRMDIPHYYCQLCKSVRKMISRGQAATHFPHDVHIFELTI